ncbi:MAG: hypothetical protein GY853_15995 [PVC group bacterium]|nr:hypothetical protein [PVC group bacterium]
MNTDSVPGFIKECEVCGGAATIAIQDVARDCLREIKELSHYKLYKRSGELHYYCDKHKRDSVTFE